uniref:Uncharacterized protein n=1 Tax=Plectus sambesii TaxID=2011161 RepID=A0A914WYQ9_9BILA
MTETPNNTFNNQDNQGKQLAGSNYGTTNLGDTHDSSQHVSYTFRDHASRIVAAPVTGPVSFGDTHHHYPKYI